MTDGGRFMRAFRPSHFCVAEDECDEDTERAKAMNLLVYAERVQAGLPLFEVGSSAQADLDGRSTRLKA